ncbi:MAG: FtsW/RodA/SpoVE family cell cycle protein [Phycisphaerae bacterium]
MNTSRVELTQTGKVILAAVMVLVVVGVACIYVTNTHYSAGHDGPRNAAKQIFRVLLSLVAGLAVLRVGYRWIARYSYFFFMASLLLLVPPFLAKVFHTSMGGVVAPRNGAYRWIHLPGFPLQPSEFMKVAFVIALAWYLRYRRNYRRFGGLLIPLMISTIPLTLILLEPDLGTCVLLVFVLMTMLFLAGAKISHLCVIALMGVAMVPLAWTQIEGYQRLRVASVLLQSDGLRKAIRERPDAYSYLATRRQAIEWPVSSGYQLVHSKNAIGSGGVLGYGWGSGMYVTGSLLPDRHNDFIFSLIAHQWGFIGCCLVLACYGVIVLCGVLIAQATTEPFARLLSIGLTSLIVTQVLVNVGMTLGLMPITGMTLPFVSYGGSSMVTNFVCIALLISVSRHRPFLLAEKPFEFGAKRRKTLYLSEPGEEVSAASP